MSSPRASRVGSTLRHHPAPTLIAFACATLVVSWTASPPASAHVTVLSTETQVGKPATVTLAVEGERSDSATISVQTFLETTAPTIAFTAADAEAWKATTDPNTKSITWTGGEIRSGQIGRFPVQFAALPDSDRIVFKVLQTYANGDVQRWIADTEQSENPAAVLRLRQVDEPGTDGVSWPIVITSFAAALTIAVTYWSSRRKKRSAIDRP